MDKQKQSSTERSRKCREKLKKDKDKHELFKLKDKLRKKQQREQDRRKAKKDPDHLKLIREKKREEMRKYREKKKATKAEKLMTDGLDILTSSNRKIAGKNIQRKKKDKDRKIKLAEKKVKEKLQKEKAVVRTQMWRMRIKMKASQETTNEDLPFPSPSSEYRAVKKVKNILPMTPSKRAQIVQKLANSPSCKTILENRGTLVSSQMKTEAKVGKNLLTSLKTLSAETNPKKGLTKGHLHARKTLRKLISETTLKSRGMQIVLEKYTGLRKMKTNAPHWTIHDRKKRKDRISENVKKDVGKFYTSGEVSRCIPNKKDASIKQNVPKFVLTVSLKEAYVTFKRKYPETKIGFISFYKLKPKNVKKISETNRRSCLCQICCNVALKVEAANNFIAGKTKLIKNLTKKDAANMTVCPYDGDYPEANCLNQECAKCGPSKIHDYFDELLEEFGSTKISYHRWEGILLPKKDNTTKRCISCVPKNTDFKEFLSDFEKDLIPVASHLFRASWQLKQLEKCKENIKENEAVVIMDFSENYTCRFQNEVQSAFWDSNQITLHPVVAYYKVSVGDSWIQRKHSMVVVSDDLKHDAHAVFRFRQEVYGKLQDECRDLNTIHEWTDGCASQYKGKTGFADISNDRKQIQRHFFETSHGKNVCDGVGATVKNVCHHAVISGKQVLGNASALYEFCREKLTVNTVEVKREFIYVDSKTILRERPEVLCAETLVGTRKVHSVKNCNKSLELLVRNLSCFCDGCLEGDVCQNSSYVTTWESKNLKNKQNVPESSRGAPKKCPSKEKVQSNSGRRGNTSSKGSEITVVGGGRNVACNSAIGSNDGVRITQLHKGDYVSVCLAGKKTRKTFYAQINDLDLESDELDLSYLVKKSDGLYILPDEPETSWESVESIVQVLPVPQIAPNISTNDRQFLKFDY